MKTLQTCSLVHDFGTRKYVVGFLFNRHEDEVLLIKKRKPEWQRGRLNGIGGSIEVGETPLEAMRREFREETGLDIVHWEKFLTMNVFNGANTEKAVVHFFLCKSDVIENAKTTTRESIHKVKTADVHIHKTVNNLSWCINMALSMGHDECVSEFEVSEIRTSPKKGSLEDR